MSQPAEISRLAQAVEQFKGRAPQNLPDGVMEKLDEVVAELGRFDTRGDTPGRREAASLAPGTEGTGEHHSKAAVGVDGPSPGQREARNLSGDIDKAVQTIAAKLGHHHG